MGNALGFPQPTFVPLPADWEKCVGRNTALVGAFHKHRPGLLEAYPKTGPRHPGRGPRSALGPMRPSARRPWKRSTPSRCLRYRAIAGCVGEEAALEFQTWEQSLDLPDPEEWLLKATLSPGDAASAAWP